MGRREVIRNIATVGPVLGVLLGPHDDVGGGFPVSTVLGRDFGVTVGPHAGRISGTEQWCWVRPSRRYPIRERRGRRRGGRVFCGGSDRDSNGGKDDDYGRVMR